MVAKDFGILFLFRDSAHAEVNNGLRLVEDTGYANQTRLIESMLASGSIPPVYDDVFDTVEELDDYEIPKDAEVRSYDADHTHIGQYIDGLQFDESVEVDKSSGTDLHQMESDGKESVPVIEAEN